jgi:hypothetical protein
MRNDTGRKTIEVVLPRSILDRMRPLVLERTASSIVEESLERFFAGQSESLPRRGFRRPVS